LIETSRLARALENVCQARMILIARVDISAAKDGLFMVASRPFASKGWTFVTRMRRSAAKACGHFRHPVRVVDCGSPSQTRHSAENNLRLEKNDFAGPANQCYKVIIAELDRA